MGTVGTAAYCQVLEAIWGTYGGTRDKRGCFGVLGSALETGGTEVTAECCDVLQDMVGTTG